MILIVLAWLFNVVVNKLMEVTHCIIYWNDSGASQVPVSLVSLVSLVNLVSWARIFLISVAAVCIFPPAFLHRPRSAVQPSEMAPVRFLSTSLGDNLCWSPQAAIQLRHFENVVFKVELLQVKWVEGWGMLRTYFGRSGQASLKANLKSMQPKRCDHSPMRLLAKTAPSIGVILCLDLPMKLQVNAFGPLQDFTSVYHFEVVRQMPGQKLIPRGDTCQILVPLVLCPSKWRHIFKWYGAHT